MFCVGDGDAAGAADDGGRNRMHHAPSLLLKVELFRTGALQFGKFACRRVRLVIIVATNLT